MNIDILRNGVKVASFNCAKGGGAVFTQSLMNEHKIIAQFLLYDYVQLQINDYIVYNGIAFKINQPPTVTKSASFAFQYSVTFESPLYDLYNKVFMDEGSATFPYSGSPSDFIDLLLTNINSIDNTWTKGAVDTADDQLISFDNISCREALNSIAQAFDMEFSLNNKEISLVKSVGTNSTLVFEYGKNGGLYELSRQGIDSSNLVTRLYVFGSEKNNNGKRLALTNNPIEANTSLFGIRENVQYFDDIFPQRQGMITSVAGDSLSFTDSSMDFDVNSYLTGTAAQVSFLSGDLVGYTAEITAYNNTTKTFYINPIQTSDGITLPDSTFKLNVGDKYTILQITMPQSYIDAAQTELSTKANEYINENSMPVVSYGLKIEMLWAKKNNILLNIGDKITIIDNDLGINQQIRVSAKSFPLYQPFNITATIADTVGYSVTQRVIAKTVANEIEIKRVNKTRQQNYWQGYANQKALHDSIFDPDGYFDPNNIKPLSIDTLMLSVGAKSQAFQLSGAYFKLSEDNLSATATAATLIHNAISIPTLGNEWAIASNAILPLPTTTSVYYLYAKCSATQLTGVWVVDTAQHTADSETGYYWFLVGVIYAVSNGYRGMSLTYGYSSINGRTITSGKIQSLDGNTYFDLDNNEIRGAIKFIDGTDAKTSVDNLNSKTDFISSTKIAGDNISTGTLLVGDASGANAGISGVTDGAIKWRFWAGADFATRANAPFRVQEDGQVWASAIHINTRDSNNNMRGVDIDSTGQNIRLYSGLLKLNDGVTTDLNTPDIDIDSNNRMISVSGDWYDGNRDSSFINKKGVFSNASSNPFIPTGGGFTDSGASVAGLLRRRSNVSTEVYAGIVGYDQSSAGDSESYGGWFNSLWQGETYLGCLSLNNPVSTYDTYITGIVIMVSEYSSNFGRTFLPYNQKKGRMIIIKCVNANRNICTQNTEVIIDNGGVQQLFVGQTRGKSAIYIWDGSYWQQCAYSG